jgi:hypothetical protein
MLDFADTSWHMEELAWTVIYIFAQKKGSPIISACTFWRIESFFYGNRRREDLREQASPGAGTDCQEWASIGCSPASIM